MIPKTKLLKLNNPQVHSVSILVGLIRFYQENINNVLPANSKEGKYILQNLVAPYGLPGIEYITIDASDKVCTDKIKNIGELCNYIIGRLELKYAK